ncbi:MAG: DUF3536 domain-containing protein [Sandaracinaceae bacterium]|nr:DUF3536 domain-containing protein [Sandaracinaceae bacterium]
MTHLVVHGHFYQPPRENPWSGVIDPEPSALPYRDWNERIHAECYRPNGVARIVDGSGHIVRIVSNYELMSFNFGPTLLSWLERMHPETHARLVRADKESARARSGHGNAIAQGYNHTILPLCNDRDEETQVLWGIADFRHRFGREPESLWLPETACNERTLETLMNAGLRYVILAPQQAQRIRRDANSEWQDVSDGSVEPSMPYLYRSKRDASKSITLFFYDGPLARSVAFDGALRSSEGLVEAFADAASGEHRLVNVATDGESYGHHFKFGDRGIAYALDVAAASRGLRVTNYGEYLDHHPATYEAEIKVGENGEGTSWSCAHGVSRWIRDCGCETGGQPDWNQAWRGPLRAAFDALRDAAIPAYERMGSDAFDAPWKVRNEYIDVVLGREPAETFIERRASRALSHGEVQRLHTLLEIQRHSMLTYTSCGWFFADVGGIEGLQVLRYAARMLEMMEDSGMTPPRERFMTHLAEAKSNIASNGTAADLFRTRVLPSRRAIASVSKEIAPTTTANLIAHALADYATAAVRRGVAVDATLAIDVCARTLRDSIAAYLDTPGDATFAAAHALVSLVSPFGLVVLERAQEVMYAALMRGVSLDKNGEELAHLLGVSIDVAEVEARKSSVPPTFEANDS